MLQEKAVGVIAGAAVGDALGGSTEGFSLQEIENRFGGYVEKIEGPFYPDYAAARPIAPFYKGDGHITDDTMMVESLISVYEQVEDHLDAFTFARLIIPELIVKTRYIPEMQKESLLIHRLYFAEKWLVQRLHLGKVDPREAGVGNMVNCGAAMYMAPVGIVNAGNPIGAYREAIEISGAHQSSFGREAAGVFAAAVAQAMVPNTTVDEIMEVAIELANDGTKQAIIATVNAARKLPTWRNNLQLLRDAFRPYDTMEDSYREAGLDARKPSRINSIEELPLALAMVTVAKGDYKESVLGGVNYGRDSDSIATMAGAICGAMYGKSVIPIEWLETVERESKRDFTATGELIAKIAEEIHRKDQTRFDQVANNQAELFKAKARA
ncbi:MAG: ADP-ribosylglycohydrolase family protein [Actinobacteria bacterium]|nr:ADP-ribosylglycohydrolase family protein [Actinomycetota bacterium]